ncbi:MAG: 2-oxoglutarate dehydrogenase E1 component [Spirochaetia bacterium]|nr:2-oxoglutarate dehydrogenase E1 component [Spirochaetia bacterium]
MANEFNSVLNGGNSELLEELYQIYTASPASVSKEWRDFFSSLNTDSSSNGKKTTSTFPNAKMSETEFTLIDNLNVKALSLIQAYRRHGHFGALLDPLGIQEPRHDYLSLESHGLKESDLKKIISAELAGKMVSLPLREIIQIMEQTYCSTLGIEFFYIKAENKRQWMIEHIEQEEDSWKITPDIQKKIYKKLFAAEYFEKFIAQKFPGKKRFSLEGGESLISVLSATVEIAGHFGINDVVFGMAHRGRLNVLYNILGKDPGSIFAEFRENITDDMKDGDVKYHLGFSNNTTTLSKNPVHLSLAFNPSHLEVVNPVILGSVRARQYSHNDEERKHFLPVLIHGDAAFAGQGINYECLNMSNLEGYKVGGSVHIIVNNQIGFTTTHQDARSTAYASDLAKILQVPILHVNADDPDACYRAVQLAMVWHQKFGSDVFIDLYCYRRHGHNETDEPSFTNPTMYSKIKKHPTTVSIYENKLKENGILSESEIQKIQKEIKTELEDAFIRSENMIVSLDPIRGLWSGIVKQPSAAPVMTGVHDAQLTRIAEYITSVPENFKLHPGIQKLLNSRRDMIFSENGNIDWGMGEAIAYGSLLVDGISIRISGQDVKRGTFSHRHAVVFNSETGDEFCPLQHIIPGQGTFNIYNSLLSEEAVLGFEFGYSLADPKNLVIWEGQFGDFANGAQVIIDQFITSCETKWNRMSGLVMLLPHGYEGQGPEHSSARLERYLQLCSQNNIQVCIPSSPAQFFHMMRRQVKQNTRKPLIVMTPKSLLRHPKAVSVKSDFTDGFFHKVIEDVEVEDLSKVKRTLFCTGKIYYELDNYRKENKITDIAIIRMEQLYPFPEEIMQEILERHKHSEICWVQEEPRNQGAFIFIEFHFKKILGLDYIIQFFGRTASCSPATGYYKVHVKEQDKIIREAASAGIKKEKVRSATA